MLVPSTHAHKPHQEQTTTMIGAKCSHVRYIVFVLRLWPMLPLSGIAAQSVTRCTEIRLPHAQKTARQQVLDILYARTLHHVDVGSNIRDALAAAAAAAAHN